MYPREVWGKTFGMAALLFVQTLIGCSGVLIRLAFVSFHLFHCQQKVLSLLRRNRSPNLCSVLRIHHDGVRNGARTPSIAAYTSMTIHVRPIILLLPSIVTIAPAVLLEGRLVGSIPEMHSHIGRIAGGVRSVGGDRWLQIGIVGIAIEAAIPACLHSNRITIHRSQIQLVDLAVLPNVCDIAIRLLPDVILRVDVKNVPLR